MIQTILVHSISLNGNVLTEIVFRPEYNLQLQHEVFYNIINYVNSCYEAQKKGSHEILKQKREGEKKR